MKDLTYEHFTSPAAREYWAQLRAHPVIESEPEQAIACEVCGDLGYVRYNLPTNHPAFGKLQPCPANCQAVKDQRDVKRGRVAKYSQLPLQYQDFTLESFMELQPDQRAGKMAGYHAACFFVREAESQNFVNRAEIATKFGQSADDDWRNWLAFFGERGRGKTGLLAAIVHAYVDVGRPILYIRLQDFINAVQSRYNAEKDELLAAPDDFGDMTANQVVDHVRMAKVLAVDEFDVPRMSDDKLAMIENVIRYRHGEKLPTVITTNLDPDGFERRWGPTIASVTKANAHWIPMRGVSLRHDADVLDFEGY